MRHWRKKNKIEDAVAVFLVGMIVGLVFIASHSTYKMMQGFNTGFEYIEEMNEHLSAPPPEIEEPKEGVELPPPFDKTNRVHVRMMIMDLAEEYGVDATTALRIAKCESGFQWDVVNYAGGTDTGIYQWTLTTWKYIGTPGDRKNPEDNIRAFMIHYPANPGWWVCK